MPDLQHLTDGTLEPLQVSQ